MYGNRLFFLLSLPMEKYEVLLLALTLSLTSQIFEFFAESVSREGRIQFSL